MTAPRQVLPGATYLLTRRCTQRQFLLRPDDKTTEVFLYCLGEAAQRFGVELIAWHAASNHWHGVIFDARGVMPAFIEHLHKMVAKVLNVRWSRWENLWSSEQPCAVRLVELEDIIDKAVYTLVNAVEDGLVDKVLEWPGANSLRLTGGRSLTVRRPKIFFRKDTSMPDVVTLVARPPRAWKGDIQSWCDRVSVAVREKERAAREQRHATGSRVVGRQTILRASAFDKPTTHEPRRNLRPHIGCLRRERRIRELGALLRFRADYADARDRFIDGHRSVTFPFGTYRFKLLGARVAAPS